MNKYRYEIAMRLLSGFIGSKEGSELLFDREPADKQTYSLVAERCVMFADALLQELDYRP